MINKQSNLSMDVSLHISAAQKLNLVKIWNSILIILMTANAIIAETIFETPHFVLEILIICILFFLILQDRFRKDELFLLVVYMLSQIGSLIVNEFDVFMLDAKQLGLAVFGAIYFRRKATDILIIHIIMFLCVLIVFIQFLIGKFPFDLGSIMKYLGEDTASRPLGLFLNYHFSAFFVAIYLLGLTKKKSLFFFDYIIIYLIGVRTSLLSYIGQKFFSFFEKKYSFNNLKGQVFFVILIILMGISSMQFIRASFDKLDRQDNSLFVIAYQISDVNTYIRMIKLLPSDIWPFIRGGIYDYSGMGLEGFAEHGNELFLVTLFVQSGLVLALLFLSFLLKNLKTFRIFMLFSLFHYSYLFSPLVLYVAFMFENEE